MNALGAVHHFKTAYRKSGTPLRRLIIKEIRKRAVEVVKACFKGRPKFADNDIAVQLALVLGAWDGATDKERTAATLLRLCVHWQEGMHELADEIFLYYGQLEAYGNESRSLSEEDRKMLTMADDYRERQRRIAQKPRQRIDEEGTSLATLIARLCHDNPDDTPGDLWPRLHGALDAENMIPVAHTDSPSRRNWYIEFQPPNGGKKKITYEYFGRLVRDAQKDNMKRN